MIEPNLIWNDPNHLCAASGQSCAAVTLPFAPGPLPFLFFRAKIENWPKGRGFVCFVFARIANQCAEYTTALYDILKQSWAGQRWRWHLFKTWSTYPTGTATRPWGSNRRSTSLRQSPLPVRTFKCWCEHVRTGPNMSTRAQRSGSQSTIIFYEYARCPARFA